MSRNANPTKKRVIVWLAVGILVAATVIIPAYNSVSKPGERFQRVVDARSVLSACVTYSKDRDEFPPNLEALIPNYIDDESLLAPDEHGSPRYLYRSGLSDTDGSREPLIISPPDESGNRLIGYVGGHVVETGTVPPEVLAEFE